MFAADWKDEDSTNEERLARMIAVAINAPETSEVSLIPLAGLYDIGKVAEALRPFIRTVETR